MVSPVGRVLRQNGPASPPRRPGSSTMSPQKSSPFRRAVGMRRTTPPCKILIGKPHGRSGGPACAMRVLFRVRGLGLGSPTPTALEEQIRVAVIDTTCKEGTDLVQRLGDIEARYQAAFIETDEAALLKQRTEVERGLSTRRNRSLGWVDHIGAHKLGSLAIPSGRTPDRPRGCRRCPRGSERGGGVPRSNDELANLNARQSCSGSSPDRRPRRTAVVERNATVQAVVAASSTIKVVPGPPGGAARAVVTTPAPKPGERVFQAQQLARCLTTQYSPSPSRCRCSAT